MFQLGGSVKEPTTLEGAVAPLAGFRGGLYKDCVFDVSAQKDAKAATSLADIINHEDDCDRLDAITTDSFQRFAFLIMIGRVGTINLDDVLVRPAEGGGLALVYGDVKKVGWHNYLKKSGVYDEEAREFRDGGPLDELRPVLQCVTARMAKSDEYEQVEWSEDYGWRDEDGRDRRDGAHMWVEWEQRPLAPSVAQLLTSWTEAEIDSALGAKESAAVAFKEAFLRLNEQKLAAAEVCSSSEGPSDGRSSESGESKKQKRVEARAEAAAEAEAKWKAHMKERLLALQAKVRAGARPSMSVINLMLRKKPEVAAAATAAAAAPVALTDEERRRKAELEAAAGLVPG